MLNNLINIHDFYALLRRCPRVVGRLASKLTTGSRERVASAWSHIDSPPTNWWDIPAVKERWNRLISGDPRVDHCRYIGQKYLAGREGLSALSLGCGTGEREIGWAALGRFASIDAYDLSSPRIEDANRRTQRTGYANCLHYHVGDVYTIEMRENQYDVILAEQSLHHFSPLRDVLTRVNGFLKEGGCFVVNEFAGPTRFQWTEMQMEVVNGLLSVLPARYLTLWDSEATKPPVLRPSRLSMMLRDPSEAVESSRILPMLHEIFQVLEIREYGGTILQLLFNGIAHNFLADDEETQRWLAVCFEVEDLLLAAGEIKSDFIVAVCTKRLASSTGSPARS
jgi:ubiquinone/menaquinone biosynthesis C-methylase UbiE